VNNAGIAVPGPLLYLKIDDFRRQIAINLTGQLIVTQAFAPLLGVDRAAAPIEAMKKFMIALARKGLPPETIGETVKTALTIARPKVRYTVAPSAMQQLMAGILPKRTLDNLIARRLGLTPPAK
jgi:NAD(P)-dependent dehydrogenase (short-subunit alcohol dehydrogenase family)